MKLLADDLIIIAAGQLAARGTVASIVSSMTHGGRILVRTPEVEKLAAALGSDAVVTPADDGDVYLTGVNAVAIGDAAQRAGIAIHQLITERPDLEAAFLELTAGKGVGQVTAEFYRLALGDPLLGPLFNGVDMMKLTAMQTAFLSMAFGGPDDYAGRDLRTAHAGLHLGDEHVDRVVALLAGARMPEEQVAVEVQCDGITAVSGDPREGFPQPRDVHEALLRKLPAGRQTRPREMPELTICARLITEYNLTATRPGA